MASSKVLRFREMSLRMLTENGTPCILTKSPTTQTYNVFAGKNMPVNAEEPINTYSAKLEDMSVILSMGDSKNFNLSGITKTSYIIPWFNDATFDETWLFNGNPISKIDKSLQLQGDMIAYIIYLEEA